MPPLILPGSGLEACRRDCNSPEPAGELSCPLLLVSRGYDANLPRRRSSCKGGARQTVGATQAYDPDMRNFNTVIRDHTGRVLRLVLNGNVYDGENRRLGFVDERGTFESNGLRVSTSVSPGLLESKADDSRPPWKR